jgi:hypothetical protein
MGMEFSALESGTNKIFIAMRKWMLLICAVFVISLLSCDNDTKLNGVITVNSEFKSGTDNWEGEFSDYSSETTDSTLEMEFSRARLPAPLDTNKYALRMQSQNRSDDMFMFLKKKVTGLEPDQAYRITFDVRLATQYPANSVGAGGSPGNSTYLKAGGSGREPVITLKNNFYEVNIDKGNQSQSGTEMVVMGDVSNGAETFEYKLVSRSNSDNPVIVRTNANGELWLCVGTDSGFEGLTIFYYDRITATLSLADND